MQKPLGIALIIIAIAFLILRKMGKISNPTWKEIVDIATVIAGIAAIVLFFIPFNPSPDATPLPTNNTIYTSTNEPPLTYTPTPLFIWINQEIELSENSTGDRKTGILASPLSIWHVCDIQSDRFQLAHTHCHLSVPEGLGVCPRPGLAQRRNNRNPLRPAQGRLSA